MLALLSCTLNVGLFLKSMDDISPPGCSNSLGEMISSMPLLIFKGMRQSSTGGALPQWGPHYPHLAEQHSFGSQPCNTISTVSYATSALIDVVCLPLSHCCCFSGVLLFRRVITCDAPLLSGPASGQPQCCPFSAWCSACTLCVGQCSLSRLSLVSARVACV